MQSSFSVASGGKLHIVILMKSAEDKKGVSNRENTFCKYSNLNKTDAELAAAEGVVLILSRIDCENEDVCEQHCL